MANQDQGIENMFDSTITIGNILEIMSIIGGGASVLVTLKTNVNNLRVTVNGMQDEIKKLGTILIDLADVRGEIKVLDTRIRAAENDIRQIQTKN